MLIDPTKLTTPKAVKDELVHIKDGVDTARKILTSHYNQRKRELRAWLAVLEDKPATETEEGE